MGAESGLAERLLALGDARDEDEVDREQRRLEVAKDASDLVLQGRLSLLHLVAMKQTKHLLTSDSKLARTEGTLLLAEVVKGTLTVLTKHEVDHVLAFFLRTSQGLAYANGDPVGVQGAARQHGGHGGVWWDQEDGGGVGRDPLCLGGHEAHEGECKAPGAVAL
mmetsp:Transcript_1396/g.4902  ORF Transcript_1396/g.4902 Transcript_1396/m.4902 type:complete len:164 (+) Transcript_1396:33-524(+)